MGRLAWNGTDKLPYDAGDLAASLEANRDTLLVLDSSFISDRTPQELWPAVLSGADRVVLLPEVMVESQDWLDRRPDHPLTRAIAACDPALRPIEMPGSSVPEREGLDYYRRLLPLRLRGLRLKELMFEEQHGRPPSRGDDFAEVRAAAQRDLRHMEADGRLQSCWAQPIAGPKRRVYTATATGRAHLHQIAVTITQAREVYDTFIDAYEELDREYRRLDDRRAHPPRRD